MQMNRLEAPSVPKKAKQLINDDDIKAVVKTLKSDFLTQGNKIEEFEKKINLKFGGKNCAVLNSGTSALLLAFLSIGLKKTI